MSEIRVQELSGNVTDSILDQTIEFALAKPTGEILGGSEKNVVFHIVDIKQCTSFDIHDIYWGTDKLKNDEDSYTPQVTGNLANGTTVDIPDGKGYIEYKAEKAWYVNAASKVSSTSIAATTGAITAASITVIPNYNDDGTESSQFKNQSVTNADGKHPTRFLDLNITATIRTESGELKDSVSKALQVNVDGKSWVRIDLAGSNGSVTVTNKDKNEVTIKANAGVLTYADLMNAVKGAADNYGAYTGFGPNKTDDLVKITISQAMEGNDGLTSANLLIPCASSSTNAIMITGAEIGDTFIATFELNYTSLAVKFTVGADQTAFFKTATDTVTWN